MESQNTPVSFKLATWLTVFFCVKDFIAFSYASRHEPSLENDFILRIAMLPVGALFWGYAAWLALVFNALAGFSIGWLVAWVKSARK
ncbi:MAG TPA: hypothetical protein VGF20_07140 [Candidatus Acidoferrum sp.]|jgi:hypothetical protein